ncbi:MAG: hypothetical protein GY839_18150 [candidate division Zixibacteria bacterium]|nr:hypothetical protein [candidate division Zixibacteria bacterium]
MRLKVNKYLLILFVLLLYPIAAICGPPDQEIKFDDKDLIIIQDSLEKEALKMALSMDSLTDEIDSLIMVSLDLYDTLDLPSFPEIIIDEKGVIKVMTDTGLIIYSIDSSLTPTHKGYYEDTDIKRRDITKWGINIVIDEGERVISDITLFSGDVTVNGSVEGDVTVIGGDIFINSTGYVRGDAISIGGKVKKEEGAKVTGSSMSINAPFLVLPTGSVFQIIQAIMLFVMVISWFFAAVSISLFSRPIVRISGKLSAHPIKSFFLGYLMYIASFLAWLLLLVSVIGIPLALIGQPIASMIIVIFAYAAGNLVLGEKLFKQASPVKAFFIGSIVSTGLPFILLLFGYLSDSLALFVINMVLLSALLFIILPLGLGAATLGRFGLPPKVKKTEKEQPQAAGPLASQTE